jgi:ribosomal protein L31
LLLFIAGLGIMHFSHVSHAQIGGAEPLQLTMTPSYPRPYQQVIVIPQSSVIDLTSSTVVVTVDGREVSRGSGAEAAYITVGGPGTATNVVVRATSGGQTYTKSLTIRPADVALVVESGSTSHPFYEGGSLIASEGGVRLVAIPDIRTSAGTSVPAANLVYTWRNGDQILQSSSGIGKSVLSAVAPTKWRDAAITLTVTTQDRSIVAEATASIAPADPYLRVYRNDPLLGPLFGTALPSDILLNGDEETFRAVPYFFSRKPAFTWEVDGIPSDSDEDVTVRASGLGSGTASLGVSAGLADTFETATAGMSVTFGEGRSLGIFGL